MSLRPLVHLTSVGSTRAQLTTIVHALLDRGVRGILALRGDQPEVHRLEDDEIPFARPPGGADPRHLARAHRWTRGLPDLPSTTIGSFPQVGEVRAARAAHRKGTLDDAGSGQAMKEEIARVIALQAELGLDVLVHGEPERNDMVQYFAENLEGFATTEHGWVQS